MLTITRHSVAFAEYALESSEKQAECDEEQMEYEMISVSVKEGD